MSEQFVTPVFRAALRPLLIAGVEKRLLLSNVFISFPLIGSTHFHFPAVLVGLLVFYCLHRQLIKISRFDPEIGKLFKRATRYSLQSYYPAKSHPAALNLRPIKTISRP